MPETPRWLHQNRYFLMTFQGFWGFYHTTLLVLTYFSIAKIFPDLGILNFWLVFHNRVFFVFQELPGPVEEMFKHVWNIFSHVQHKFEHVLNMLETCQMHAQTWPKHGPTFVQTWSRHDVNSETNKHLVWTWDDPCLNLIQTAPFGRSDGRSDVSTIENPILCIVLKTIQKTSHMHYHLPTNH